MRDVKSISFSGPLTLEGARLPVLSFWAKLLTPASIPSKLPSNVLVPSTISPTRSVYCGRSRQMMIPSSALLVQPNGEALTLDPASLESSVVTDLQQAISSNILVVETLRLDPDGRMRLEYKTCLPIGKSPRQW